MVWPLAQGTSVFKYNASARGNPRKEVCRVVPGPASVHSSPPGWAMQLSTLSTQKKLWGAMNGARAQQKPSVMNVPPELRQVHLPLSSVVVMYPLPRNELRYPTPPGTGDSEPSLRELKSS